MPLTKKLAHGDMCPECRNAKLKYDNGEVQSREDRDQPATVFCPICGECFEIDYRRCNHRWAAEQIVEKLFTNGNGDKADRLQLRQKSGGILERDIGGYCKGAVLDLIAAEIDDRL